MPLWVRDSARDDLEVYGAQPSYAKLAPWTILPQIGDSEAKAVLNEETTRAHLREWGPRGARGR
jgi:hypothetical protein